MAALPSGPHLPRMIMVTRAFMGRSTSHSKDPAPPSSRQWYNSPILLDAEHEIVISRIAGTSVDYIVVTAGQFTPLSGKTLIVDNTDESMIEYEGAWSRVEELYIANDDPHTGLPYGNSTHQTLVPGSSATFKFSGSLVSLYGLYSWDTPGSLQVLYTLDGTNTSQTYSVTPTTLEFKDGVRQREHFLFFSSNDTISTGEHTLRIELTNVVNHSLALDYILYTPTFATLAGKPQLGLPHFTTESSMSTTTVGTGETSVSAPPPGIGNRTPIGPIVGGALGGAACLLLFLIALVLVRRRKPAYSENETSSASLPQTRTGSFQPFTLESPTTTMVISGQKGALSISSPLPMNDHPELNSRDPLPNHGNTGPLTSQQKSSLHALSLIAPSASASRVAPPTLNTGPTFPDDAATGTRVHADLDVGERRGEGLDLRVRMRRLEELVQELNHEIGVGGGNTARVAELRGRIAELTRRDSEIGSGSPDMDPPAYELRHD
ncbi:hypothetical protein BDZ94DRAFT_1309370 [Collybia nuda]|uniref:Uncharacterized protein n=1 Tax=Collybia nuda TaxID=64659 RepID=A0A9P6CJG7_9AGAR|nr:hypothetical protein BDZ94DRAFT_1309370 [Collybia nuda]